VAASESGVIVLLHRTESGAQLLERLAGGPEESAPAKMDLRTYGIGAQILRDLGIKRMKLLGTPRRMPSMVGFDLEVTGFVSPGERP
jgi:3,4-dihydroxy 2-butanone 4-phosphate synthase/GTP cyclohydrolase II